MQSDFTFALLKPSTDLSVLEYRNVVVSLESNILNSKLTCTEQFPLLAATAVGKATTTYWATQIKNPKSPALGHQLLPKDLGGNTY